MRAHNPSSFFWFGALALTASLAACVVHDDSSPRGADDGTVTVDWTIDDSKSADGCNANGATSIQITVITAGGSNAGTYEEACAAFATAIPLPPGRYTANALLVDSSDRPLTTAVAIDPFTIESGGDLNIPIDFPQSSFE